MTTMTEEKKPTATKKGKAAVKESGKKEKVRAGENVIEYAETNHVEAPKEKAPTPKKAPVPPTMLRGFDRLTGKEVQVELSKVKAISRYIYVNNIFDPTPVIEAIVYKAIVPNTTIVVMDIDEATFEDLRNNPKSKLKVFYNYVDGMAKNDPKKNQFYHRTYSVKYPEWIKPEDVKKQTQDIVSHYGIPDLSGIEKTLWPDFDGRIKKKSLGAVDEVDEETEEVEETEDGAQEEEVKEASE